MKIKINPRSIEKLNHFRCKDCNKWWSVGDAPEGKENWWCPWCGKENSYKIFTEAAPQ
jgi:phage FluMu protein Com